MELVTKIGFITSGQFSTSLDCQEENLSESIKVGAYCKVLDAEKNIDFFCLVTDSQIESTNLNPNFIPTNNSNLFTKLFTKFNTKRRLKLNPLLQLSNNKYYPVTQLPAALSNVFITTKNDFSLIFGQENFSDKPKVNIGSPVGNNEATICIDLQKFIERSNGVFGKTGTGKTFLTRILLASLLKTNLCSQLIFDMHGEYGVSARSEGDEEFVLGLKSLFPHKVMLFSLDPEATRQRGCAPDIEVFFDLSEISVDDVIALQDELNLHSTALEVANLLFASFGKQWLYKLLNDGITLKELAAQIGAHTESLSALYRKVKRIESLPFIQKNGLEKKSRINELLLEFFERKTSVILEFGRQNSNLAYLLVSGILTRQIHKSYVKKTEKFLATQKASDKPAPLVITIEEAHNFLNPTLARQTIFGKIAREMRKYFVTLLVVDQRPSGICEEIISQLGTKLLTKLEDEKDINAVFCGSSSSFQLKNLNQSLGPKGQAIIFGHSLPIPVLVNTRYYGKEFYQKIKDNNTLNKSLAEEISEIF